MQGKSIDILNLGLVVLSFWLAREFPYGLFLFAYAILGPIHYLTEVNWIKEKGYFFRNSLWPIVAIVCSVFLAMPFWLSYAITFFEVESEKLLQIAAVITQYSFTFLLIPLFYVLRTKKDENHKYLLLLVILVAGAAYFFSDSMIPVLIGTLIPTLIHVYFFTLIFMLYGARKPDNYLPYVPIIGLIVCSICIFILPISADLYSINDTVKSEFISNGFYMLNTKLRNWIGVSDGKSFYFYEEFELRMQMFLSFAYTYHYFNWFIKTSVIGWHKKIDIRSIVVIGLIWITSLSLFAFDYALGVAFTVFLSYIHVVLEFPLNALSIKSLFVLDSRKIE